MNDIKELNRIRREFLKYMFTVMQNVPRGVIPNSLVLTQVVKERFNTEHSTVLVQLHHAGMRGEMDGCIILQDKKNAVLNYDLYQMGYPSYGEIHGRSDLERRSQMNCIVYVEFRNGALYSLRTLTPDAFNGKWKAGDDWRCVEYSFAPPCLRYAEDRDPEIHALHHKIESSWNNLDDMNAFVDKWHGKQSPNVLRTIKYKNEHPGDIDVCVSKHREIFPADVVLKYNWDIMHHKDFATLQCLDKLPERKVIAAPSTHYVNGALVEYIAQDYNHMPRKLKEFEYMMQNYEPVTNEF